MLRTPLKRALKYISLSLLIAFTLSGCVNNTTSNTNNDTSNKVETENKQNETENVAADDASIKSINELEKNIVENWPQMDKVWPGLDYTNNNLLLFVLGNDGNLVSAWLMNTSGKRRLSPEEYANINYPSMGGFEELKFEGKDSIMLGVDEESLAAPDTFEFITHELVHLYYQNDIDKVEGSRTQEYPIKYEPRLYRTMIYRNLSSAVISDDDATSQNYIQKAAYWYNKWKNEYPDEFNSIRSTDIFEGHAQYIGILSNFIGKGVTRDDISQRVDQNAVLTTLGTDSYGMGFVALTLLDRANPDFKNDFLKSGKSPIEFLLDDVAEIEDTADEKLVDELQQKIASLNDLVKEQIENVITAMDDKNIPYLKINSNYRVGSVALGGFFSYNESTIYAELSASFEQDSSNKLEIQNLSVSDKDDFFVIPLTEEFEIKDDTIILKGNKVKGTLKVTTSTEDGRTIYTTK